MLSNVEKQVVLKKDLFNSTERLVYLLEVQHISFYYKEGSLLHFHIIYFCIKRIFFLLYSIFFSALLQCSLFLPKFGVPLLFMEKKKSKAL